VEKQMKKSGPSETSKKPGPHAAAYLVGRNYTITAKMFDRLREVPFHENSKVLQLGGTISFLPFQIASEFNCRVTVAYPDPIWLEMTEVFPTIPVSLIEVLPGLDNLRGQEFDVVMLHPGELKKILGEELPDLISSPSPAYWDSIEGKVLIDKTREILAGVKGVLAARGEVIVVESFSSYSLYALATAFEHANFYLEYPDIINPPLQEGKEFSVLAFAQSRPTPYIKDIPLAAAIKMCLGEGSIPFHEAAAESLRNLFAGSPMRTLDYEGDEDPEMEIVWHEELLEKEGFGLLYKVSSKGDKLAFLMSAIEIPGGMAHLNKKEEEMFSRGLLKAGDDSKEDICWLNVHSPQRLLGSLPGGLLTKRRQDGRNYDPATPSMGGLCEIACRARRL
jgi:hypothetical protein